MAAERVVVAMSGGVDSSVAAAILKDQGWDVVGVSLLLSGPSGEGGSRSCCSVEDFRDARRVADRLKIPYYVFDFQEEFRSSVTERFASDYLSGRTPNPCILCNRDLKFDLLRRRALTMGADWIATGHYARIEWDQETSRGRLLKALDSDKDQSYFLFSLSQAELSRTLFPLGTLSKSEVRGLARRFELPVAAKRESQEICFVPGRRYCEFVERMAPPGAIRPGAIVDDQGRVVGKHGGIHRFTVGQRRGLGVAAGRPLYVTAIDASRNIVKIGPRGRLHSSGLLAEEVNWILEPFSGMARVKTRYRQTSFAATISPLEGRKAVVRFLEHFPAVAPGQAAVFYRGDEVLGGGFIAGSL